MIIAPLFALALAAQPPELTNFEIAVQCAATLKVATAGMTGPHALEAARQGREFERVAREIGRNLSRNVDARMQEYEQALNVTKTSNPADLAAGMEACRAQGAIYFPPPAAPAS